MGSSFYSSVSSSPSPNNQKQMIPYTFSTFWYYGCQCGWSAALSAL
jgi:hypothetical protein